MAERSHQTRVLIVVGPAVLARSASIVFGALFHAIVGWLVDDLVLLEQVADNTRTTN